MRQDRVVETSQFVLFQQSFSLVRCADNFLDHESRDLFPKEFHDGLTGLTSEIRNTDFEWDSIVIFDRMVQPRSTHDRLCEQT